jgi:type III restriction enzyme
VRALPERADLEIRFPRVDDFFMDVGTELDVDETGLEPIVMAPSTEPGRVHLGEGATYYGGSEVAMLRAAEETVSARAVFRPERLQTTIFRIAHAIVDKMPSEHRPYLFNRVLEVTRRYVDTKVIRNGLPLEMLALPIYDGIQRDSSTRYVSFSTRKPVYATTRSHVNYVVCDPARDDVPKERLWEYRVAEILDHHEAVRSFVKNDHLHFHIRYRYEGDSRSYLPDFLVSLRKKDGSYPTLILEVKGEEDNRDRAKYTFARSWVDAVNRDGEYGRWAFAVVRKPEEVEGVLARHIA